jgi:hypothetical protein
MTSKMTTKPFRAQISVCTWRGIDVPTIQAINLTKKLANPKFDCMFGYGDALISRTRSTEATKFLKHSSMGDVLLFIDTDIVFEPHQAAELATLCHDGYPIVGGLYVTRQTDHPKAAIRLKPGTQIDFSGSPDPLEIDFASTGFFAIHRKVLEAMAKTMPLCHPGDRHEMYPFFMPMTYDAMGQWEYLSEDWAFCERARQLGFKTFVAPTVCVGHLGERVYWVNDLFQKSTDTTYAVVTEGVACKSEMINDLAAAQGMDPRGVAESLSLRNPLDELIREWSTARPASSVEVAKFWADEPVAVTALAMERIAEGFRGRLLNASNFALSISGPILDLGGLGDFSITAKRNEREPIYVEGPGNMRNFTLARLRRRHIDIPCFENLDNLQLPNGHNIQPHAAVAVDTFSICHPEEVNRLIHSTYARLVPGGKMYISMWQQNNLPFCMTSEDQVISMMQAAGFRGGSQLWEKPT